MLKFNASVFASALQRLALAQTLMSLAKDGTISWDPKESVPKDGIIATHLRGLQGSLRELGARFTLRLVERVISNIDAEEYATDTCHEDLRAINERLSHEFDDVYVFTITAERAKYLKDGVAPFGDEVAAKFPSSTYDIVEAAKCLGLGRSTACVMHTMRALETPLALMAMPFDVSTAYTNWHNVLDQIEAGIEGMNSTSGPDWKERQKFFAGAASHFRMIKDGWRNHAMHGREKYTEPEAQAIYDSSGAFMRHLSEQLSDGS